MYTPSLTTWFTRFNAPHCFLVSASTLSAARLYIKVFAYDANHRRRCPRWRASRSGTGGCPSEQQARTERPWCIRLVIAWRFTVSSLEIQLSVVPVRFTRMHYRGKYNTSERADLLDYGIGDTFVSFDAAAVC